MGGLFIWNEVMITETIDGAPLPMKNGIRVVFVILIFIFARAYTFIIEGLNRLDKISHLMRFIVLIVTIGAIGGSHYGVYYGVNRMATDQVNHWGMVYLGCMILELIGWDVISMLIHYRWAKWVNETNSYDSKDSWKA
jgi:hypothetical protein